VTSSTLSPLELNPVECQKGIDESEEDEIYHIHSLVYNVEAHFCTKLYICISGNEDDSGRAMLWVLLLLILQKFGRL
jgi:hypothetical protein